MRRTVMTLTAVGVLFAAAACGQGDDQFAAGDPQASPAAENASARRVAPDQESTTSSAPASTTTTAGTTTTTAEPGPTADGPGSAGGTSGPCGSTAPPAAASLRQRPADAPPECLTPQPEPRPAPEPELGTGDVQVTLRWESRADVDLHVTEPDGTEIWYQNRGPSSTGGQLDVDSNVGCVQGPSVENVYWPPDAGPTGSYTVEVVGFQVDGCGSGAYTVTVKVRGEEVLRESGTVGEDETDSYEFEV